MKWSTPLPEQEETQRQIWRWAAYTLFSRHSQYHVERVELDCRFLGNDAIATLRATHSADDPLALLLDVSREDQPEWLPASRFYGESRGDSPSESVFEVDKAITVRTIAEMDQGGEKWWKVLVPGLGEAWIRDCDTRQHEDRGDREVPDRECGQVPRVKFLEMTQREKCRALKLMRVIHESVKVVEVGPLDDEFPGDGWPRQVLSICTNLEELILPGNMHLRGIGELLHAAENGNLQLSRLLMDQVFEWELPRTAEFVDLLSDNTHPFTQTLQELTTSLAIEDDSQ